MATENEGCGKVRKSATEWQREKTKTQKLPTWGQRQGGRAGFRVYLGSR